MMQMRAVATSASESTPKDSICIRLSSSVGWKRRQGTMPTASTMTSSTPSPAARWSWTLRPSELSQ